MLSQQIRSSGSLLDSIDAIRNWRAVCVLLASLVAMAVLLALGSVLAATSGALFVLFALAGYVIFFYGANAAGMMVMDEARGGVSRPARAAVSASLATSHRLILVFLLLGAIYLAGFIVLALVLFICKLPLLGPVLYAVVFPVAVVIAGVALFALPTVVFPLSAPAVWSGASTLQSISQLLAIARKRLLLVLLMMIAVAFIAGFVALLIGAILMSGAVVTTALSVPILGPASMGGYAGMMGGLPGAGGMGGMGGMTGMGGYAAAAMVGGGILFAVAFTLPGMVYLRGACTVYLRAIDGLDLAAEQADMDEKLAAAASRARELKEQAQAATRRAAAPEAPAQPASPAYAAAPAVVPAPMTAPSPLPSPAVAPPLTDRPTATPAGPVPSAVGPSAALPPAPPLACPQCKAAVAPGDYFCGECGRKLK